VVLSVRVDIEDDRAIVAVELDPTFYGGTRLQAWAREDSEWRDDDC
jgi:hypothetical protein